MGKHYRPPGKKKEGNAARYMTRSQATKNLQASLPLFRRLCILKGVFPREPKKKFKGNHQTYYHVKDIAFLHHEPLLEKFREIRVYDKKVKKALAKKNKELANILQKRKPDYTLDKLIKERYPKFVDALRDLDDCLTMVHLFAALPAKEGEKISVERIHNCQRLCHEWQAYISCTHKLRKTFISVKGIFYQAEIEGQKVTWLTPHALQQVLTDEIDLTIMLIFLEFYETLLAFVNFKLYHSLNIDYPPIPGSAGSAGIYSLSRYIDAHRMGQIVDQISNEDEDDEDTKVCKNLFKDMKFFLGREAPRESLLVLIPAFGGLVSWDEDGSPFKEADPSITHQIVDRPTQSHKFLSREYVQPQWLYDCVNARVLLPTEGYQVGRVPPPHLSPFADDEAEGYVPQYAETIKRLQAAARKELTLFPGVEKEDFEDPQNQLVEGIINRAEATEAAKRRQEVSQLEQQYHDELKMELQEAGLQALDDDIEVGVEVGKEERAPDLQQAVDDGANMSEVLLSRKKRGLVEAIRINKERKRTRVETLKARKKEIEATQD